MVKLRTFWDTLTGHRTDEALLRPVTRVYDSERPEAAEVRLRAFREEIMATQKEFIQD